ncbi:hypothetical protein [Halococcus hamelinensis]|uniref:hypothetical protein n=1 Tax=Halococcus hamelinensis TaxID=332168 RepID=UPI000AC105DD|nr:hypothetical protein [Halococcus hamelinensis]
MDCPLCGTGLPAARPGYRIALRVSDGTRSAASDDGTVGPVPLCEDCWRGIEADLS